MSRHDDDSGTEAEYLDSQWDGDPDIWRTDHYRNEHLSLPGQGEGRAKCRYCGNGPFTWVLFEGGWRLATPNGKKHKCKAHPSKGEQP